MTVSKFSLLWLLTVMFEHGVEGDKITHSGVQTFNIAGMNVPLHFGNDENEIVHDMKEGGLIELFRRILEYGTISTDDFAMDICVKGISASCCNDTIKFLKDLNKMELYTGQMIDAAAKPPSGIMQGKRAWIGSYAECVNVHSPPDNVTGRQVTGRYCLGKTKVKSEDLVFGVCVPHSCRAPDMNALIGAIYKFLQKPVTTTMTCEEPRPYTTGDKVALVVCCIIALMVVMGTSVDLILTYSDNQKERENYHSSEIGETNERTELLQHQASIQEQIQSPHTNRQRGKLSQAMVAFSLLANTRKLLTTSTSSGQLTSLNGLRVLSMFWVILGHTYLFSSKSMNADNPIVLRHFLKRLSFQAIFNASFSVDTFFFMSGFLVTYLYFKKKCENTGRFNWGLFYFHRFWRLTPVYAFCIMLCGTLLLQTVRGPAWLWVQHAPYLQTALHECSRTWWANLLYITNYYPYSGDLNLQCMGWSWYLANDMQFYIVSPVILILLYRYRKIGLAVCGGVIGACIFIRAMTAFEFGIQVPFLTISKHTDNYYGQHNPLYNKSYTRIAPYIIGMLLGYVLHRTNCKVTMSKVKVTLGWSFAIATGLSVVYGLHYYCYHGYNASLETSVIYIAFNRFAWSLAVAWVIFACATGYGGIVNRLLSWKVWAPLGRLTYCAYLVHPMLLYIFFSQPFTYFISDINMMCYFLGVLVLSYSAAFILSVTVEAPMIGLEKNFITR